MGLSGSQSSCFDSIDAAGGGIYYCAIWTPELCHSHVIVS